MWAPKISLSQTLRWTAWAALLSFIGGFAAQGEAWAMAAIFAFAMACFVRVFVALAYLDFHAIGWWLERRAARRKRAKQ